MKKRLILQILLFQIALYSQSEIVVNTFLENDQRDPQLITNNNGKIIVVWKSENQTFPDSQGDIKIQILDSDLNKIGAEVLINDFFIGDQTRPDAAMNEYDDFIIAWASYSGSDSMYDIKAKLYKNDLPYTNEFLVNTTVINSQTNPSVDIFSDGSFIVVWESWFEDGSDRGIFAQRYSSDGNKIGLQFQVNTNTNFSQTKPVVKYFPDGKFVVIWESWKQFSSSSSYDIYARLFDGNGNPLGSEFRVNDYTADYQWYADVIITDPDKFIVCWCSWEQDGYDGGVFIKSFDANGSALTNEVLVNSTTRYFQWLPRLALTTDNNIIVTWSSWLQDSSREGIYAKILDENLSAKSFEERLNYTTEDFQWEPEILGVGKDEIIAVWASYIPEAKNYDIIAIKKKLLLKEASIDNTGLNHISGISTTTFNVNIVDSTKLTGNSYEMSFAQDSSERLYATIKNLFNQEIVINQFYLDQGEDVYYLTPVFDGVNVEIKPVLSLGLDFNNSYFLNNSVTNINFNFVKPSGITVIAPIDLVLIWGDPSKNSEGYYISPLDSAYSSSGKMEIKVPFTVKNLVNKNRLNTYVIEPTATKNKQWDPGESIIIITPQEYQISFPNFHAQINSTIPVGNINFPLPGDTIFIFTRRPITTEDVFTFSTESNYINSVDEDLRFDLNDFRLDQNYPNPFNPTTTITFSISEDGLTKIKIFNMLGELVAIILNDFLFEGTHRVQFNSSQFSLASGIYLYTLETANKFNSKKMILLK